MLRLFPALTALALAFLLAATAAAAPPHLVCFFSDDLGGLDTSIHGSPDVRTPTLDRLAAQGMVFDNAYVASPSCCPNRYSLLTGLMPARHGAHPNHSKPVDGTRFLSEDLAGLGYTLASFGKVSHGKGRFPGLAHLAKDRENMSHDLAAFLKKEDPEGPLCIFSGDRRPHVTWSEFDGSYDPEKVSLPWNFVDTPITREHRARYYQDISAMDAEMARVLKIARKRFGEDVFFLFTSDHGGQWPLGKWNLYDSGARVPLVVVWPGKVKPGTRSDAFVSWVDILPTLLDVAGGEVPEGIDGRSILPVLLGETDSHRDRIFTTHTGDGNKNIFPIRSVRSGKFKLVHNLCPEAYHTNHSNFLRRDGAGAWWDSWEAAAETDPAAAAKIKRYYERPEFELFDLDKDPDERRNLAANPEYAATLKELKAELAAWMKSQGDPGEPHTEPYPKGKPLPELK